MNVEDIRLYCLEKESCYRVVSRLMIQHWCLRWQGKMFALLSLDKQSVNLKCDPDKSHRIS